MKINGIKYFIKVHQSDKTKPYFMMLHGFMGSGRVFGHLVDRLRPFCNPVAVDLLGHGKTAHAQTAQRFYASKQVDDLTGIIQNITDKKIYLHGYSMGGRLAQQFAIAKPNMLQGLILESSNPGLRKQKKRTERQEIDKQRAERIKKDFDSFLDDWEKIPLFNSQSSTNESRERYHVIQHKQNPRQMALSLQGFGTGAMPAVPLEKLKIPVLLLTGQNDPKYSAIMPAMNQRIPNSQIKIINDASHRVHVNQPHSLISHIKSLII